MAIASTYYMSLLIGLTVVLLFTPKNRLYDIFNYIPHLTFLNSSLVLLNFALGRSSIGHEGFTGFISYPGINAALIAVGAAVSGPVVWLVALPAIILAKCSIPYGVLVISFIANMVYCRHFSLLSIGLILAFISTALFFEGGRLFDASMRFDVYHVYAQDFFSSRNILFGVGPGLFEVYGPMVQKKYHFYPYGEDQQYLAMHSDILQCIYENGVIGSILFLLLNIKMLVELYCARNFNSRAAFIIVCGILSLSVFDFPFRYMIFTFIYFLIAANLTLKS